MHDFKSNTYNERCSFDYMQVVNYYTKPLTMYMRHNSIATIIVKERRQARIQGVLYM